MKAYINAWARDQKGGTPRKGALMSSEDMDLFNLTAGIKTKMVPKR